MTTFSVDTHERCQMLPITREVRDVVRDSGVGEGLCVVFVPHTTAAVTVNEQADPSVVHDVLLTLDRHFPRDADGYRHAEGNSDAHVKACFMGSSETLIVTAGDLLLGTWQGLFFCEFDGPRRRQVHVKVLASG